MYLGVFGDGDYRMEKEIESTQIEILSLDFNCLYRCHLPCHNLVNIDYLP